MSIFCISCVHKSLIYFVTNDIFLLYFLYVFVIIKLMEKSFGFITGRKTVEDYLDYAIAHNFDHIEIDLRPDHSGLATFDRERIFNLKKKTSDQQISISLHLPYSLNLTKKNRFLKNRILKYLKYSVELASELRATHITSHIGTFSRSAIWSNPRKDYLERAIGNILEISYLCEKFNIKFALENLIPLPAHSAYHFIGDNLKDFEQIFFSVRSDIIGLCLDIGHSNLSEGALEYIKHFENKIFCIHYHDNNGKRDEHLEIGEGNINWKKVIGQLERICFKGPYISECFRSEPYQTRKKLLEII